MLKSILCLFSDSVDRAVDDDATRRDVGHADIAVAIRGRDVECGAVTRRISGVRREDESRGR